MNIHCSIRTIRRYRAHLFEHFVACINACLSSCWLGVMLLLSAITVSATTQASTEVDLYTAQVPVTSQLPQAREAAAQQGLIDVLIKATGNAQIDQVAEVREELPRAINYVSAYSYETTVQDGERQTRINVDYSAALMTAFMQRAGLPLWPANRPDVLVWLVEDTSGQGRQLVTDLATQTSLNQPAAKRGVPLMYPLFDMDDVLNTDINAFWNMHWPSINGASSRYERDAILVGVYSTTSQGLWLSSWAMQLDDQTIEFNIEADSFELMGARAMARVADYLAQRYAIVLGQDDIDLAVMTVEDITDFSRHHRVLAYLEQLAIVDKVELAAVTPQAMTLYVHLNGSVNQLVKAMALDSVITDRGEPQQALLKNGLYIPLGRANNPLRYYWK